MTRRQSPLAVYRLLLVGVVVALAGLTFLFLRGPDAWQRRYYQLDHQKQIAESAERHRVNPNLVAAVIEAESDWQADAMSTAGAQGLMQVMPSTAEELARRGRVDEKKYPASRLSDPAVNIEYGTAYLRYLVERYHEVETALAAYNAGLANADLWSARGGDIRRQIEFPETRFFVLKVSRGKDRYEELYPDAFGGRQ
jgi:soluble lytic murein transglycosylase